MVRSVYRKRRKHRKTIIEQRNERYYNGIYRSPCVSRLVCKVRIKKLKNSFFPGIIFPVKSVLQIRVFFY